MTTKATPAVRTSPMSTMFRVFASALTSLSSRSFFIVCALREKRKENSSTMVLELFSSSFHLHFLGVSSSEFVIDGLELLVENEDQGFSGIDERRGLESQTNVSNDLSWIFIIFLFLNLGQGLTSCLQFFFQLRLSEECSFSPTSIFRLRVRSACLAVAF